MYFFVDSTLTMGFFCSNYCVKIKEIPVRYSKFGQMGSIKASK